MTDGQRAVQPNGHLRSLLEVNIAAAAAQDGARSGSNDGSDASPLTASHQSAENRSDSAAGSGGAHRTARLRAFYPALFGGLARSTGDGAANPASSGVKTLQRRHQRNPGPVRQQNVPKA